MVDQRSHHIAEEDSQHHALGESGVHHADDHSQGTNDESVDPLAAVGARTRHGVGSHKHGTEGESAIYQVLIPCDRLSCLLEHHSHHASANHHAQHGAP